jgi:hypothetical protein
MFLNLKKLAQFDCSHAFLMDCIAACTMDGISNADAVHFDLRMDASRLIVSSLSVIQVADT